MVRGLRSTSAPLSSTASLVILDNYNWCINEIYAFLLNTSYSLKHRLIFGLQSGNITLLGTQINNLSDVLLVFRSSLQAFTTQEVGCALATQNLTAAQYAQMSSALSLEGETVSLTAAKVQEAAATAGLTEAQTSAIVSTLGLSTAHKSLTVSAIGAKAGIIALNAALGLGLGIAIIGISKLISAVSEKIHEITHRNEILKESIENLSAETQDIKSDLQNLNEQLEETREKLKDLSGIDNFDIASKTATVELQKQNDLLEAQIALKERELEFKNEETNQTIEAWYKEAWQKDTRGERVLEERNGITSDYYVEKTEEEYFREQILRAEELYNKQKQLNEHAASLNKADIAAMTTEQMAALQLSEDEQKELLEIQKYITDITGELNQQVIGYNAVTDKQHDTLSKWNDIIIKASKFASFELWNKQDDIDQPETIVDDVETLSDRLKDASDSIDDYQDRITSLRSIMNSQYDMSSTDLIDFMQQVNDWDINFDWEEFGVTGERGVGDLSSALAKLNTILTEQINEKYPELSTQLNAISEDAVASAKGFDTLSNAFQTLSDHHSLLDSVQESIKDTGVISVETSNEIIAAYPQMQAALFDYLSGVKSAEDVYQDLANAYQSDLDLYYQLVLQKKELDYSFYEQVYDNLPAWVQNYLDAYQKDFGNFKNLAEAKIRLQEQFLKLEEQAQLTDNWALDLRVDATREREKIQEILNTIQETELDVSGIKEPTFNKDIKSDNSKSEDTPSVHQIDWAANSIDNISHHIDYLNKVLDNSNNYKQRHSYLTQLISSQNLYNESLERQAELYKNEYLNAVKAVPQYRKLIESGATFKVEEFVDQDDLYNAITKAQDLYASWRDINTAQQDAVKSLKEYEDQLNENIIEHLASEIQLVQNDIDSIDSDLDVDTEFHIVGDEHKIINSWKKEKYEQLIALSSDMQELLEQKLAKFHSQLNDIDPETDDYYELQNQIAECEQAINNCVKSQREYNAAILSLPITQYQKQLDLVDRQIDILGKIKDKYANYISAVTYSIDEEINSIADSKESLEDYYDSLIEPIQNQLDILQETNDERERALALQKAYYDLENAKNNLSVKTYVEGQGFVYRADENAIREAQDALDSALYDKAVNTLQGQIDDYEATRDALLEDYDKEIDRLNRLKDSWSNIISQIESLALVEEFKVQFGDSTLARIIDGRDTSTIQNVTQWVSKVQGELDSLNIEKQNLEDVVNTLQLVVESYEDGSINVDAAMTKINEVVADHTEMITTLNQKHVESVITLSNEYKKSVDILGGSQEELSDNTESSNNKMRNVIARTCSQIKSSYNQLSNFMSSFRTDMINNIHDVGDAAMKMADDVASSVDSANSAISNVSTSAPQPQQSSSSSNKTSIGTAIVTGIATVIGAIFKHDGMESGLVAKDQSEANRDSIFKRIALDDLKANEVPAVLQVGEAVLTKKQQDNVVRNMVTGVDYGMKFAQGINKTSNVDIHIPEIHVHEVQNADSLAHEIVKSFKTRMIQEVRK